MTQFTLNELEVILNSLPFGGAFQMVERKINEIKTTNGQAKRDWDLWCNQFGLTPAQFGKVFTIRAHTFKVIGISPRKPKFCIQAERLSDGKKFGVPVSCVR